MTKRELKKQQKNEALVEKISQMTDAEYAKKQNRLLKSIFALNGVSLVFLAVILSSVILLGFNLHAFSLFARVIIGSMAGVAATEIIRAGRIR